jgi:hypothetical protein
MTHGGMLKNKEERMISNICMALTLIHHVTVRHHVNPVPPLYGITVIPYVCRILHRIDPRATGQNQIDAVLLHTV